MTFIFTSNYKILSKQWHLDSTGIATLEEIYMEADKKLFNKILCNSAHVLQPLLPNRLLKQAFTISVPALMINFLMTKLCTSMNVIFLCICYTATVIDSVTIDLLV